MSNRFTERKQLQKRILHQRIAFAVLLIGFIILFVLGIVGLVKLIQKPSVEETMVVSDDDMQMLIDLKEMMKQKELTIILDAGHGGNDVGTGDESYWEKDLNMDIVLKMKDMLSYCGVNVLLTRDGDETLALDKRSAFANEHEEADYFVSVHCNYCEDDASVRGLECYYWEGSEQGKNYAQSIIDTVALEDWIVVRGIKTDNFHVLRETKMPAILIETGYLSNAEEKKNLYDDTYQKTVALFLVKGIISGALD